MATVTSFTKERILAIEAATIVDGEVDGSGHLILTRHDSTTIDAGSVVGPTGPTGPAVGPGSIGYTQLAADQRMMSGDFKWSMQQVDHAGWLKMDGRNNFPRTGGTYDSLFAVIGTSLGAGVDGSTFGIGDVSKRVMIGKTASGAGSTLGGIGGSADAVVVSHNHTQNAHNHTQDSHNHTQNAHNHTQDAHGHAADDNDTGNHVHGVDGGDTGFRILITHGAASGKLSTTGNAEPALPSNLSSGGQHNHNITVNNNTATNQAATPTNLATTSTNQAATAANQAAGVAGTDANLPPYIVMNGFIHI